MVPDHIWAPDFFGPREIWTQRSLVPERGTKKFVSSMKIITWLFHAGPKLLGTKISRGPNFLGPKIQISQAPKKLGVQMRSGTISVITHFVTCLFAYRSRALKSRSLLRAALRFLRLLYYMKM